MSRIGKRVLVIPEGVIVDVNEKINEGYLNVRSNSYIEDNIIDKIQIFLYFLGSFKSGGRRYIYTIPEKVPILDRPKINVLL